MTVARTVREPSGAAMEDRPRERDVSVDEVEYGDDWGCAGEMGDTLLPLLLLYSCGRRRRGNLCCCVGWRSGVLFSWNDLHWLMLLDNNNNRNAQHVVLDEIISNFIITYLLRTGESR